MRFFLNIEEKMAHDQRVQREEEKQQKSSAVDYHLHSMKTCKRQRQTQRALKNKKRAERRRQESDWLEEESPENHPGVEGPKKLYPAIDLLRDPQGLAEHVFRRLRSGNSNTKFETKMLMINFVTRLTGNHELLKPNAISSQSIPNIVFTVKALTSSVISGSGSGIYP